MATDLATAVAKILQQYEDGIITDVAQLTKKFGQQGAKELKAASGIFGGGGYSGGWTSKLQTNRLGATAIIYNQKPGLPHLLEKGHAKRGGGRVSGRTHIAPVEEKLVQEFTKAVEGII